MLLEMNVTQILHDKDIIYLSYLLLPGTVRGSFLGDVEWRHQGVIAGFGGVRDHSEANV